MIIENSLVGCSKSDGTIRNAIEGTWEVKTYVTRSVRPRFTEQTGFLITRIEAGRDSKMEYELLEDK